MTLQRERPKFLAAVLGAATLAVWSIPAFAETVRVRNIQVSETAGNTAVVIAASARPTFTTWKLEQPARVVVELSGARLGNVDVPLDAGTFAVGLVSASVTEDDSAGPRTRIVLTLRQTSDYKVEAKGNDITLRVIPRVRPPLAAQESAEARTQAEARTKAEAQARNEAQAKERAKERAEALARADAQAKTEAEVQARANALAKTEAEVQARADALAKAEKLAQAKAEALAKTEAQTRLKAEAQAKVEAQTQAKAEALAKAEAQTQAKAEALAQVEAQTRAKAEALAKVEAQTQAKAEALAKTEVQAQAKAEALAKTEAQAQAKAEVLAKTEAQARIKAEAQAKTEAQAQAKAEAQERSLAQRKTEALLKDESKQRLAAETAAQAHSRAEAAAKLETDRLRKELADAHRETARAKAAASAAGEESQRQKLALAQAESQVKRAQSEAERARKHADSAVGEAVAARLREAERDRALRLASEEVGSRQKTLDRIAQKQAEQQSRLAAAARLVSERESTVRDSESRLSEREEAARAARARRDSLASDASKSSKAEAAAAMAEAERQRKNAVSAAEQSRQELTLAVASRRQEEARKDEQANLRQAEENRLEKAVAQRKAEESRLADAHAERSRLDEERAKLESERTQLETARNALLAEVNRLKSTVATTTAVAAKPEKAKEATGSVPAPATKPALAASTPVAPPLPVTSTPVAKPAPMASAPVAKPAPMASALVAKPAPAAPLPSPATTSRPRSVTLHALSHIRSIDFVDEPNRASVIIDVDDSTLFSIERVAGRRLSLRIEHSDLPESLARNLDASEYLGPVKIISSYRDPAARGTVRVDVDLAEDVPNRVRLDGNRIFWDFQKARAPSLPAVWVPPPSSMPSVMFVPARKVAGFVATTKDGLWVGQAAPPPYLAPPAQSASSAQPGDTAALPAGSVAPAGAAPEARQGSSTGGSSRYATVGKKRYTGRRIDLDFKGADIHNILRLLADVGQVNVIVADDVRGEVTIKMRDVPWDQALDVVLRSKGLGSVREGNLLRVAPLALLEKELEAEIARQKQIADVLPIETRLIGVSYAEAAQLMDKIRDLLSPRGKVSEDHRTNTLIVSDVTKNLQLIEDLVRNLDTQTAQVMIEARIVEANSNFARQIGVQWGGTAFADTTHGNPTGLVFPYNVGVGGGADDGSSPLGGLVPGPRTGTGTSGNPNFLVNMPAPAGLGTGSAIGLTLGSVAGAFNLNLRLSAMESTGAVRILSSPRITTMDNVQANIEQGVSIPVSVVSAMGAQTQFVDAKLRLGVKPHVTNEGTISMVIDVTRNEPDFVNTGARGDPSIQKKEAKTTMLVRDGDTAVIGGIYTRNTGLSNARVPFFSDIPVLGWFFRNRKENDNRSEFLVFITPRIVNRSRVAGQ